jgi:hypothetical protein
MGKDTFSRDSYTAATRGLGPTVTTKGVQVVKDTGELHPLVKPDGYGITRRSLMRYNSVGAELRWQVSVGLPIPVEIRLDTTGSMGDNVDKAMQVLPDTYTLSSSMLPRCDLQIANSIFGDYFADKHVLCRGQFEMATEKLVNQLTLMVPEGNGGDADEDPQFGLFGAAYLTQRQCTAFGLKGYDFTISDACGRETFHRDYIPLVFGPTVFNVVAENGHVIDQGGLLTTKGIVTDLLKNTHAFFLQVGDSPHVTKFWTDIYGPERVIVLPRVELLPHVQAVIIGLTEGTLEMEGVMSFLTENSVGKREAHQIARSVANIPMGAQAVLREKSPYIPKKGDVFENKTDTRPVDPATLQNDTEETDESDWL